MSVLFTFPVSGLAATCFGHEKAPGNRGSDQVCFRCIVERETGLEPATFCLEGRHSTN